jgi:hypothetical protein
VRTPEIFNLAHQRHLIRGRWLPKKKRIRHGDATTGPQDWSPPNEEVLRRRKMNPRALSPQNVDILYRDGTFEGIRQLECREVLQANARRQLHGVAISTSIPLYAKDDATECCSQHACRPTETRTDIDDHAGARDARERCKFEYRLDAARMVLVGDLRDRVNRELPFIQISEIASITMKPRKDRFGAQRMRRIDLVQFHHSAIELHTNMRSARTNT